MPSSASRQACRSFGEGHKGCYEYTTQIRGLEGHGSLPDAGVNAVESAVRIIHELLETGETLRQRAPADSRFTLPWTTVSVGKIEGGIARNIIAKDCTFEWEIRPVQRSDSDLVWDRLHTLIDGSLLPEMQKRYEGAYIRTETAGEVDGLEPMSDSEATALVRELTGGNTTDVVSFGTEAGLFQNAGISTVVCGPGYIDQAHRPDEFVDVEQLNACLRMMERLKGKLFFVNAKPVTHDYAHSCRRIALRRMRQWPSFTVSASNTPIMGRVPRTLPLLGKHFRVIAMDTPGMGASAPHPDGPSIETYADAVSRCSSTWTSIVVPLSATTPAVS